MIREYLDLDDDYLILKNTTNSVVLEYPEIAEFHAYDYYSWKQLI
jgi:hypothetical protein